MEYIIVTLVIVFAGVGAFTIVNLVSKAITGVVLKIKNKKNKK